LNRHPASPASAITLAVADYLLGFPGPFTCPADLDVAVVQLGAQLSPARDLVCTECGGVLGNHRPGCPGRARRAGGLTGTRPETRRQP
jgi:hypothetical protein